MTYSLIKSFNFADPEEANNNFYHIGQGDLLPNDGENLDRIDNVYELGTSLNRFKNLYVNSISSSFTVKTPYIIEETERTTTALSSIGVGTLTVFDNNYEIYFSAEGFTGVTYIGFGFTETTKTLSRLRYVTTGSTAFQKTAVHGIELFSGSHTTNFFTKIKINKSLDGSNFFVIAESSIFQQKTATTDIIYDISGGLVPAITSGVFYFYVTSGSFINTNFTTLRI